MRYVPPEILVVDLVFLILHRAIDMNIPFNHHYIHAELLDMFRYLLSERQAGERRGRGRGRGLRMRVGGHRCAVDAPVAPAPPPGPICPEHAPGPCPPWLPLYCVEHGPGPARFKGLLPR